MRMHRHGPEAFMPTAPEDAVKNRQPDSVVVARDRRVGHQAKPVQLSLVVPANPDNEPVRVGVRPLRPCQALWRIAVTEHVERIGIGLRDPVEQKQQLERRV